MKDVIWIEATPTKPGCDLNRVGLSVGYMKGRGLVYTAYPGSDDGGIIGVVITSGINQTIEPMARDNKKKVAEALETARWNVEHREGIAWAMLQKVAAASALALPAPAPQGWDSV